MAGSVMSLWRLVVLCTRVGVLGCVYVFVFVHGDIGNMRSNGLRCYLRWSNNNKKRLLPG